MRKSEWYVLAFGTTVISNLLFLLKWLYLKPLSDLSNIISPSATSNLEVITSMSFFIVNLLALILMGFVPIFFINGWLQGKAESHEKLWNSEEKLKFTGQLNKAINKSKNKELKKVWDKLSYITPYAKSYSNFLEIVANYLSVHEKEHLHVAFDTAIFEATEIPEEKES